MSPDARATVAIASFETLPLTRIVCAAVRETAPAAELVVVDTGSTDGTREWAAERRWLRLEAMDGLPRGPEAHGIALDRALALAGREWLVALDSDAIPRRADWLARLTAPLEARPPAAACGTTKDPCEISRWRRFLARLSGKTPGPEWTYLRPNRAAYRIEPLRALGLSFRMGPPPAAPGERRENVGERLARTLAARGHGLALVPPADMEDLIAHLRHATMALSPALFPRARRRDLRAARRRIDAFLATPRARELIARAEA